MTARYAGFHLTVKKFVVPFDKQANQDAIIRPGQSVYDPTNRLTLTLCMDRQL